ncbi:MAG: hypothetical protein JWM32_2106 [Verrucomicrobia bacterium]|nr:hypothetical protein [Verrucomicrobiota bacterium]
MKYHALIIAAGLLALVPFSADAAIVRTVEKSFTVTPGGVLKVETQGGDVRILTSGDAIVKVIAKEKIRAGSESDADLILQKLTLTIEQEEGGVSAISKYEKDSNFHFGSWPPVQVDFTITVPRNYNVELKTSGGDVAVADLNGTVNARTSGGNISLAKITGEVVAHTSGGNVSLTEGGAAVKLGTSGGDIRLGHAVGPANLNTSGGNVEIKAVENTIDASTSGGNVTAAIVGGIKGDCRLSTSGGRVRVAVDKTAAFHLDASTSGGDVEAGGLTITVERGASGKSRFAGKVNGGGPELKLRSSGGDIDIDVK